MRRVLASAVGTVALLGSLCLYAESRGAPHAGGFRASPIPRATRSSPRVVAPAAPSQSGRSARRFAYPLSIPPVQGSSLIDSGQNSCLLNPSYSGSLYCRQYFSGRPSLGVEPLYPYWMPNGNYNNEAEQVAPAAPLPDDQLAAQVGNLTAQMEMMQQAQAPRAYPPPELPAPPEVLPPTVLVYRDGRHVEVQNYAVMGKTLWIFFGQASRQVPLSELDLAATQRLNGDRSVEFVAPKSQ